MFVWCEEIILEIYPRLDKDQNFGRNVDVLWIKNCTRPERPPIFFSKL